MASAARDMRYGSSVDGSLARELDWAVRERELRHAGEAPKQREAERVHAAPHVRVREQQHVSVFTLLGFAAVLGMAVLLLLGYTQLTVVSADTVALKEELKELETQNVVLTAQYEQMFDLTTVREAAEAAGMSKPSASQICYLDISGGDSAVVYQKKESGTLDRILTSLNHGVYAVVEYFQ